MCWFDFVETVDISFVVEDAVVVVVVAVAGDDDYGGDDGLNGLNVDFDVNSDDDDFDLMERLLSGLKFKEKNFIKIWSKYKNIQF